MNHLNRREFNTLLGATAASLAIPFKLFCKDLHCVPENIVCSLCGALIERMWSVNDLYLLGGSGRRLHAKESMDKIRSPILSVGIKDSNSKLSCYGFLL